MAKSDFNEGRREFLLRLTSLVATLGAGAAVWPFLQAFRPSVTEEDAGKPVEVLLSQLKEGEQKTVIWRGKPVWIIRRSSQQVATLKETMQLSDPTSRVPQQPKAMANNTRSLRPDILVLLGVCTHLGCAPTYRPDPGGVEPNWPGGFFCSCHGSKFDLAGRVYKGMPAPTNLEVPPYHFKDPNTLVVGTLA